MQVTLAKPVRVFSAFGMLSNLTSMSTSQLRASYAQHCAPAEQRMIHASSCYGKRCRFALRALVLQQLDSARVPLRERHRERSCLREARACPLVMSLSFWAPHDGGEGFGKLSSHHGGSGKHKAEPLYVDDREANDVLAVYRVMLSSTFCVHIGGDTPTRKSFIDAIIATCIPVVFQSDSTLLESLPYRDTIPYERMVVYVPIAAEREAAAAAAGAAVASAAAPAAEVAGGEERVTRSLVPIKGGERGEDTVEATRTDSSGRLLSKATHQRKARLQDAGAAATATPTRAAPSAAAASSAVPEAATPVEPLRFDGKSLVDILGDVPADAVQAKQALLRRYAPMLQYPYPKMLPKSSAQAGEVPSGPNAVSLALDRLAGDVAEG